MRILTGCGDKKTKRPSNPEYDGLQIVRLFPATKMAHPVRVIVVDATRDGRKANGGDVGKGKGRWTDGVGGSTSQSTTGPLLSVVD